MNKNRLLFLFFIILHQFGLAQQIKLDSTTSKNKTLINVDTAGVFSGEKVGEVFIQHLSQNVILSYNGSQMFCDSAVLNQLNNSFTAYGNVYIVESDGTTLSAEYIKYNGNNRTCIAKKDVILYDQENSLWTNNLTYNFRTKIGEYSTKGTLQNNATTVTSDKGIYNGKSKWTRFTGHVNIEDPEYTIVSDELEYNTDSKMVNFLKYSEVYKDRSLMITKGGSYDSKNSIAKFNKRSTLYNDDQHIEADTLHYNKQNGLAWCKGKVIAKDTVEKSMLYCNEAFYNEKYKEVIALNNPILVRYDTTKKDSSFIIADTFHTISVPNGINVFVKKDSLGQEKTISDTTYSRIFLAWKKVKILSDSLQSITDSMVYSQVDSTLRLYGHPHIWSENRQMIGDTIYAFLNGKNQLDSLFILNNSSVMTKLEDVPEGFDQIRGIHVFLWFSNGEMKRIYVDKNAECIYYAKDNDKKYIGIHQSESNFMDVLFTDTKDLKSISLYEKISGSMTPMHGTNYSSMKLENLEWKEEDRPKSKTEFYKRINFNSYKSEKITSPSPMKKSKTKKYK